jgi:hypothetical protein
MTYIVVNRYNDGNGYSASAYKSSADTADEAHDEFWNGEESEPEPEHFDGAVLIFEVETGKKVYDFGDWW